jgi:hypothetical protein
VLPILRYVDVVRKAIFSDSVLPELVLLSLAIDVASFVPYIYHLCDSTPAAGSRERRSRRMKDPVGCRWLMTRVCNVCIHRVRPRAGSRGGAAGSCPRMAEPDLDSTFHNNLRFRRCMSSERRMDFSSPHPTETPCGFHAGWTKSRQLISPLDFPKLMGVNSSYSALSPGTWDHNYRTIERTGNHQHGERRHSPLISGS